ncbi:MAG: hypothetical protein FRX48_05583 [Lasallia pustulata]|uniref:Uncharacterized protein n=1 Tax=Lasallia pustulata TaxID=136370 RepID=A0A5M8PNU4_9LECA|nr:MAG: hypothetical protein FRX48_05583 [Lasallia pustulata]
MQKKKSAPARVREALGLGTENTSSTWEALLVEFRVWHRDPAYPERQYLARNSEGFDSEMYDFSAHLAQKYLTAANSELDTNAPKWPNDAETIMKQLYGLSAYESSENRRWRKGRNLNPSSKLQRRIIYPRVSRLATSLSPLQPQQSFPTVNTESSAGMIDAAGQSKALINIPAHASSTTLTASFDAPVHRPFRVELPHILDMTNTKAAEAGDSIGSSYISLGQNSQPFQTTLTEHQLARTTLLIRISTNSYVIPIPFHQVSTTAAFTAAVLDAWCLDAAMRGRIESVTINV